MKTFLACLETYLDHCLSADQSPMTVLGKRSHGSMFIAWCIGHGIKRPMNLKPMDLEAYRAYLYKDYRTRSGKPIDVATRRNHLTDLLTFLRWLKRSGQIPVNPGLDFDLPRVPRRLSQVWLEPEEAELVFRRADLNGSHGIRDRALLETLYATGIRRKEVAGLDIPDINFKARTIKVTKGKGGNERYVPIAVRACKAIRRYLREVRPQLSTLVSGDALFLDNQGKRYPVRKVSRLVKQYVARSGVAKRGACNLYRHSTATLMLRGGADIRHVQEMLGHADISTTQIYTHVEIGSLQEVYERTHPAAVSGGSHGQ